VHCLGGVASTVQRVQPGGRAERIAPKGATPSARLSHTTGYDAAVEVDAARETLVTPAGKSRHFSIPPNERTIAAGSGGVAHHHRTVAADGAGFTNVGVRQEADRLEELDLAGRAAEII